MVLSSRYLAGTTGLITCSCSKQKKFSPHRFHRPIVAAVRLSSQERGSAPQNILIRDCQLITL